MRVVCWTDCRRAWLLSTTDFNQIPTQGSTGLPFLFTFQEEMNARGFNRTPCQGRRQLLGRRASVHKILCKTHVPLHVLTRFFVCFLFFCQVFFVKFSKWPKTPFVKFLQIYQLRQETVNNYTEWIRQLVGYYHSLCQIGMIQIDNAFLSTININL